eukprot:COSAG06_NODE_51503_length_311_cov_1.674528_1_plen_87_part_10
MLIRHNFTHETEPFSTRGVMNGEALQITLCRKHFRAVIADFQLGSSFRLHRHHHLLRRSAAAGRTVLLKYYTVLQNAQKEGMSCWLR